MGTNLRDIANKYLEKTLENPNRAGTPYIIIDPQDNQYPVTGTIGDISLLVDAMTGEVMQGRTIIATCIMKRLPLPPRRGWRAEVKTLSGEK
jgi:microcystin degradation protein MlrC